MPKTRQLNIRPSARALAAIDYLLAAGYAENQTQVIERALIAAEKRRKRRNAQPPP